MYQRIRVTGATAFLESIRIQTFQLNYPQRTVHR